MSSTPSLFPDADMGDISTCTPKDFEVPSLGECSFETTRPRFAFVGEQERVLVQTRFTDFSVLNTDLSFAIAGQREKMFFDPHSTIVGIVTCGGLCPGLNDVIRALTYASINYGVKKVLGFQYGYSGLSAHGSVIKLEPKDVNSIHKLGGTFLGSTRGSIPAAEMVDTLVREKVNILFTIGGDGTQAGANAIFQEVTRRGLKIAVVGVPKTIDNDICFITRTFGFDTAVEKAREAIASAHSEAASLPYGIGLVKVMGRDSGFIAAKATVASGDVNICLIPEEPFTLDGLMRRIEDRLLKRNHCVIVTAEGAGVDLLKTYRPADVQTDASGNVRAGDIGPLLQQLIKEHFSSWGPKNPDPRRRIKPTLKYIDPSYTIRSCKPTAADAAFCEELGNKAVDSALCGKTGCIVGFWNEYFTLVPFNLITGRRKKLCVTGTMWSTVRQMTWPDVPEHADEEGASSSTASS